MKWKTLFTILLFLTVQTLLAQGDRTVTGTVSDSQGPLPGASVVIKGTTTGTQTDFDGNYTLDDVPSDATLEISYIGYAAQDIPVDGQTTINATLVEDAEALAEVVVVGYGTQKKEDITGSISVVESDEINKQPNANALSSVQGKVAGVNITNSGRPGASPNVRIRGVGSVSNSDPLYVVDGVLTNDISYLNSNDIESMSILKDASSSAIYGIRAANGVIVIKTKRGRGTEENVSFSYDAFAGFQKVTNVPTLVNAAQYVQLFNEKQAFEGTGNTISLADFNADTNWFDEILRRSAPTTSHNISISGTSNKTQYFLGFGYFDQEGVLDAGRGINTSDDFRRLTGRIGIDVDLNKYFTFGGSVAYTDTKDNNAPEPFYQAYIAPPIFNAINPDGTYGSPQGVGNFANPRATLDFSRDKAKGNRVLANVYTELKPIESLTVRVSFSGDYSNSRDYNYTPVYRVSTNQGADVSTLTRNYIENDNWLWENTATWTKTFDKHNITLLAGFSQEERIYFKMTGVADEVAFNGNDAVLYLGLGNADTEEVNDEDLKPGTNPFLAGYNTNSMASIY